MWVTSPGGHEYDNGAPVPECRLCGITGYHPLNKCTVSTYAATVNAYVASATTWVDDGHVYNPTLDACDTCGLPYASYRQGPVPCARIAGPPPASAWAHGHCSCCKIELCPPLDGEGAVNCAKCVRTWPGGLQEAYGR